MKKILFVFLMLFVVSSLESQDSLRLIIVAGGHEKSQAAKQNIDPNVLNIILGILSGILTYFLIEFSIRWYKKKFVPWFEERLYSDIDLTDIWVEKYIPLDPDEQENNQEQNILIELKQRAHTLTGIAI